MANSFAGGPGPDESVPARCVGCEEDVLDRGFPFGADAVLCFRCAVARGGAWDERRERWVVEPETADLGYDR